MNEDTKTKLEEKKGAAMGEEELNNVAGGSFEENQDILEVMSRIDPQGVKEFTQNWDQTSPDAPSKLAIGMMKLMEKNGLNTKKINAYLNADRIANFYRIDGEFVQHEEFMKELEEHAWQVIKK